MTARSAGSRTVLVANRGEIALRIMRTLHRMGMRAAAIHSDADATAPHVRRADTAVRVGCGAGPAESYLDIDAVVAAAQKAGAALVHPGYGFLSENAEFARACAAAGLTFVGPPPAAVEEMGDKIRAKRAVAAAGVPLLPGFAEKPGQPMSPGELARAAAEAGYPLLLKPAAGGGGKGMRSVRAPEELEEAAAAARREAQAAFGDATLLAERLLDGARHVEVQILADTHGTVVHLGERECSLQRRHQKIVEEAPSPLLAPEQRAAMGEAAVAAARACGYVGAGTVEFIVSPGGGPEGGAPYFFLEMNTRLQVEHPVTELCTTIAGHRGVDLVELQLRVALGERLPFSQADIGLAGHAVEARVYAEDPARGFLPTGGPVLLLEEPAGPDVRVDSGVVEGAEVTSSFDPLLAKVITWGADRGRALERMDAALCGYTLLGCGTNTVFLRHLLRHPDVAAGRLSTELAERVQPEPGSDTVPQEVYAAAALDRQLGLEPLRETAERFDVPDNWRVGTAAWTSWRLRASGREPVAVRVRRCPEDGNPQRYEVAVGEGEPVAAAAARDEEDRALVVSSGGRTVRYARAEDGPGLWLGLDGASWHLREERRTAPLRAAGGTSDTTVRSPMPGTVLAVPVAEGQRISAGSTVAVVEAMKMEHPVTSAVDGVVTRVEVHPGDSVAVDAVLVTFAPETPAQQEG